MISTFNKTDFTAICDLLASKDADLAKIIQQHGYPPLWSRKPTFETLIHIILEQQVSLASAKAALDKLKQKLGTITPERLLLLSDEEMRLCYFSRQKTVYARHLSNEIISKRFSVSKLRKLVDDEVRMNLKAIKGIGNWTADVFLMMCLQRTDCFPVGDIALVNSMKKVKRLPEDCSKDEIVAIAEKWKPNRTIAAYLLWHDYLSERKQKAEKRTSKPA